ncbi:MAG TPA: pyridoxamine 5'-phosphate oxidase [Cytophagaceae bacterium]|jgi:pyridoxamine 5'-phosphate oxidase|nr:pyridoxamine 5'-phosphate oxidase [Cytophagaceae bacterium]
MGVLANIRNDYNLSILSEEDVLRNPIEQSSKWLEEAIAHKITEPTAMNLSTVSQNGRPSSRIVLLKEIASDGFVFFTNYSSKKGQELFANPLAAITIFWKELERQIRIEGKIEKIPPQESDLYYYSRPLGSRIGAIVSPQSQVISDRSILENKVKLLEQKPEKEIIRPENWGGYKLIPDYIEFWQGRKNRLHDRLVFTWKENSWTLERLAP